MSRIPKLPQPRSLLQKSVTSLGPVALPSGWIDANSGVSFSAAAGGVTSRVRDSLVLRLVAKRHPRRVPHAAGAR